MRALISHHGSRAARHRTLSGPVRRYGDVLVWIGLFLAFALLSAVFWVALTFIVRSFEPLVSWHMAHLGRPHFGPGG